MAPSANGKNAKEYRISGSCIVRQAGRGRVAAVDWASNEPRPVTVTSPGVLDVTVWRRKDSLTVHPFNLTNPMMIKGPIQKMTVRLPEGSRWKKLQLLSCPADQVRTEGFGSARSTA